MSVSVTNNAVNNYAAQSNNTAPATNDNKNNEADKTNNQNSNLNVPEDKVAISGQNPENNKQKSATYGKPANPELVAKMKKEAQESHNQLRNMVEKLILKQGQTINDVLNGKGMVKIDEETRKAAQEAIGEDGYYGVEKTAERITEFAKALIGDDMSKLPMIRDAVEKGFKAAEKVWGGKLPDISQQTYDKIKAEFDSWEKAGAIPAAKS